MSEIKIPGPQAGLNEIIDAFTVKRIETEAGKWTSSNPLRPSAAGKCERELGYEFTQFRGFATYPTETKEPSVHRLLNLGDKIEWHANDEMQAAFRHMPTPPAIKYKQQTVSFFKFTDGSFLEGKIDLCIEIDGHSIVCDWKSKGDKYSQFYKSSWDEFPERLCKTGYAVSFGKDAVFITDLHEFLQKFDDPFFANNLYQLNLYANSEFLRERGYSLCSILQYNKNDSRIREVRFAPSVLVYEQTKSKFLKVQSTVDSEKHPDSLRREYVLGSMKCAFCPFRKECWPENDALKAWFAELPKKQWPKDLDRLPPVLFDQVEPLFREYEAALKAEGPRDRAERALVGLLYENKIFKVRVAPDRIYQVKRLKEGLVLRRSKL